MYISYYAKKNNIFNRSFIADLFDSKWNKLDLKIIPLNKLINFLNQTLPEFLKKIAF